MKILLINPPVKNIIRLELPSWVRENEGFFPPLGLMYISAYLKKHSDAKVMILDAVARNLSYARLEEEIRSFAPDAVGMTVHTHNLVDAVMTAQIVKKTGSRIHVNFGGPHARIYPGQTLGLPCVDSVIPGEGEMAFASLVKRLENNLCLTDVPGLVTKNGSGPVVQDTGELDTLPFPDRQDPGLGTYYSILGQGSAMTTMVTSRGCPYSCSFCSTPKGAYRMRSAENVVAEMGQCHALGIKEINFVDDTFNFDTVRMEKICSLILESGLRIKWSFRGRVDKLNPALLKLAKKSGCVRINLGVETSTDAGLRELRKGITVAQVRQAFRWTREAGITTVAYFLLGCPHERKKEDILTTIRFSRELDPDYALFNILMPYPDTPVYREGLLKGVIKSDSWEEFARNPRSGFIPQLWEEWLSREELFVLLDLAYRRFYFRPRVAWRTLVSCRSLGSFKRRLLAGLRIYRRA